MIPTSPAPHRHGYDDAGYRGSLVNPRHSDKGSRVCTFHHAGTWRAQTVTPKTWVSSALFLEGGGVAPGNHLCFSSCHVWWKRKCFVFAVKKKLPETFSRTICGFVQVVHQEASYLLLLLLPGLSHMALILRCWFHLFRLNSLCACEAMLPPSVQIRNWRIRFLKCLYIFIFIYFIFFQISQNFDFSHELLIIIIWLN